MINLLINYQKIVSWKILKINLTIRVVKFCLFSTKEKCLQWICIPYFVVLSSYFSICIWNTKQVLQIISVHVKTTPEFPQIERFSQSLLHRVLEPKFAKLCSMYERGIGSIFDKQCETNCNKPVCSGQSFQSYVLVKILYRKWK